MPSPSNLGVQIEGAFSSAGYATCTAGHSEYLLRYRTSTGVPFAIGRTAVNGVRFWFAANEGARIALEKAGFTCEVSVPTARNKERKGTGRSSNLDAIPEFKDQTVYWTRVTTPGDALTVVLAIS
jgi:hypothetical protein